MKQTPAWEQRLRDLLGTDLPANELRRLAHTDAQLRLTVAHDRASRETLVNGVRRVIYNDPDGNDVGFGGAPSGDSHDRP
jgi:hypothetical protein